MRRDQMAWLAAVIWFGLGVAHDNMFLELSAMMMFLLPLWLDYRERKVAKKKSEQVDRYER